MNARDIFYLGAVQHIRRPSFAALVGEAECAAFLRCGARSGYFQVLATPANARRQTVR